eukprot:gene12549-8599_t
MDASLHVGDPHSLSLSLVLPHMQVRQTHCTIRLRRWGLLGPLHRVFHCLVSSSHFPF